MRRLLLALLLLVPSTALANPTTRQVTVVRDVVAHSEITNAHVTQVSAVGGSPFLECIFDNQTDGDLILSIDGSTDHYDIRAGAVMVKAWGDKGLHAAGPISVKYSTDPTEGNLLISCEY